MNKSGRKLIDVKKIRKDFPMLAVKKDGKPLVYLDSAASGHKPQCVIDCLQRLYTKEYAKPNEENEESKKITKQLEDTRSKVADFLNASSKEIVFSRGCTESINIIALSFEREILKKGDEVLITELEHHANIIPWQLACKNTGAKLRVAPITPSSELDMVAFKKMITAKTKLISLVHSSHVLGTILPIRDVTKMAHERDIPVLVMGRKQHLICQLM